MDKVTVMKDIDELHDTYCSDCLVIRQLRKERGKPGAHRFCIEACSVGEKSDSVRRLPLAVRTA